MVRVVAPIRLARLGERGGRGAARLELVVVVEELEREVQ